MQPPNALHLSVDTGDTVRMITTVIAPMDISGPESGCAGRNMRPQNPAAQLRRGTSPHDLPTHFRSKKLDTDPGHSLDVRSDFSGRALAALDPVADVGPCQGTLALSFEGLHELRFRGELRDRVLESGDRSIGVHPKMVAYVTMQAPVFLVDFSYNALGCRA